MYIFGTVFIIFHPKYAAFATVKMNLLSETCSGTAEQISKISIDKNILGIPSYLIGYLNILGRYLTVIKQNFHSINRLF